MAYVEYFGGLRNMTGKTEEELTAENLKSLIGHIGALYGKKAGRFAKSSLIVVDDKRVLSIGKVKFSDSSRVGFYPTAGAK